MSGLVLRGGAATDVGRVRTVNEDAHLVDDDRRLYVVADGMGGHRAGEVASSTAVRTLAEGLAARTIWALVAGVRDANGAVLAAAVADPELRGMGTTLCSVAVVLDESGAERLGVVNVGDSRVYLLAGGALRQLSDDHSLVEELVREGRLTEEEAEGHPRRNVLTRALGVESGVLVDAWMLGAARGDRLLLCSDGLINEVAESEIQRVLEAGAGPEETAAELVRLACEMGGRDNVTCLVVDVVESDQSPVVPVAERFEQVDTDPRAPEDPDDVDDLESQPDPDGNADDNADTDTATGATAGATDTAATTGAGSSTEAGSPVDAVADEPPAEVIRRRRAASARPMGPAVRILWIVAVVALLALAAFTVFVLVG